MYMSKIKSFKLLFLLGVCLSVFASCSDDDDNKVAKPEINLTEIGHDNSKIGTVGDDLHLEGDITAEGVIKKITVELHQEDGDGFEIEKIYTDGKYIGVKNAVFHEHIDIPAEAPSGEYHLHFIVEDAVGQTSTVEAHVQIEAATAE